MAQATTHNPTRKELRDFGLTMAGAIAGIFGLLLPWIFDHSIPLWPWPVALLFAAAGLIVPMSLKQVFHWWMKFGHLVSRITTPLILGILFYLIITPFGLVRRLLRKDSMARRINPASQSYRIDSRQPDNNHMERPF